MRANHRAIDSYGQVKVSTGASQSNNVELIQMLFDGLIESLSAAKGHIQHNNLNEKSKAIARASRIVLGLQGALDFEKGGDLASNLNELYNYVTRRLLHVNARNDLEALDEIHGLMTEIRSAWETVPALIPRPAMASIAVN
jgi:flagellar protein FliS